MAPLRTVYEAPAGPQSAPGRPGGESVASTVTIVLEAPTRSEIVEALALTRDAGDRAKLRVEVRKVACSG